MTDDPAPTPVRMTRRTALAGLGAAGLAGTLGAPAERAAAQGGETESERGLVYGTVAGEALLMDVTRPTDRTASLPALVLIHGGSFVAGSRAETSGFAADLAKAGFAAYGVDYRLFDRATGANAWPAGLDDVQRAVRWLRSHAAEQGIDPDRIGALGHSTGGHLAAFLGTRETRDNGDPALADYSSRAACVVNMSGETDFTIPYPSASDTALYAQLLGGTADAPPPADAYADLSPITFVDEATAPFLLIHGAEDRSVPVEHSRRMEAALHAAGVETIYAEFPRLAHGDVFSWSLVGPFVLAFVDRHLKQGYV